MLNYVSQPSLEVIQILLIIGSVLSYNMNAGASYTLLGEYHSDAPRQQLKANCSNERNDGAHVYGAGPSCRDLGVSTSHASGAEKSMVRGIPEISESDGGIFGG